MNKIVAICGMIMLGTTATPNYQESYMETLPTHEVTGVAALANTTDKNCITCHDSLDLNKIVFLEADASFDLGFNTADYLPADFNPYEMYVDLDAITYLEREDDEADLGFDTAYWLPAGFDPYAAPTDIDGFSFMEDETSLIFPELDTKAYLPKNFDPYASDKTSPQKGNTTDKPEAR